MGDHEEVEPNVTKMKSQQKTTIVMMSVKYIILLTISSFDIKSWKFSNTVSFCSCDHEEVKPML